MKAVLQKPAKEFMTKQVLSVERGAPIKDLFKLFDQQKIMGVPVVDAKGRVAGMVTETDMIRHLTTIEEPKAIHVLGSLLYLEDIHAFNESLKKHCAETVDAVMTSPAITIGPDATLQEVIDLMAAKRISRLPVADTAGKLLGLISRTDVVHQLAQLKNV